MCGLWRSREVGYGTDYDVICVRSSGLGEAFEGLDDRKGHPAAKKGANRFLDGSVPLWE